MIFRYLHKLEEESKETSIIEIIKEGKYSVRLLKFQFYPNNLIFYTEIIKVPTQINEN